MNEFWKNLDIDDEQLVIATDQMILIYLYIVIRSKIVNMFAHIKYITEFTTPYVRNSNLGFNLATYEHALYTLLQNDQAGLQEMKEKGVPNIIDMSIEPIDPHRSTFNTNNMSRATMMPDEFENSVDAFVEMSQNGSYILDSSK